MRAAAGLCNTIYWFALTMWVGVLVAAAVSAATTFTVLPEIGLALDAYGALPASEHGRIAAGKVMEPIFTFVDIAQLAMAAVVLLCVFLQWLVFGYSMRRVANAIRIIALLLAAGVFAWRAVTLTPGMNRELRAYWAAAEAGQVEQATAHRATFNTQHPRASDLFSATLALLVVGVLASPAALAAPSSSSAGTPSPASSRLEVPQLSRSG